MSRYVSPSLTIQCHLPLFRQCAFTRQPTRRMIGNKSTSAFTLEGPMNSKIPRLGQKVCEQSVKEHENKNLSNLVPTCHLHFSLNKAGTLNDLGATFSPHSWLAFRVMAVVSRKATVANVLLEKLLFLEPSLPKPQLKLLGIIDRDRRDGEPAPIHVDRLWGTALKVCRAERKVVLAVAAATKNQSLSALVEANLAAYGTPSYATVQSYTQSTVPFNSCKQ